MATSISQICQMLWATTVFPKSLRTSLLRIRSRPGPANSSLAGSPDPGTGTAASRFPVATSSTAILPPSIAATSEPSGERARDTGSLGYQMLAWKGEMSGRWRSSRFSRSGPPLPAPSSGSSQTAQRPSGENRTATPVAPATWTERVRTKRPVGTSTRKQGSNRRRESHPQTPIHDPGEALT